MFRFFFLCCLCSNVFGQQIFHIAPGKKITGVISNKELNRIAVKDDRIAQIFGVSGHFLVETDENNGQIFLKSTDPSNQENLALTLVTEKGITQDLYLRQRNISAQIIELHHPQNNKKKAEIWEKQTPYQQSLVKLMLAMVRGKNISGFKFEVNEQTRPIFADLEIKQLQILTGSKLRGVIFEITNRDKIPKFLPEKRFAFFKNAAAIAVQKQYLNPGQSTKLYVIHHV